MESILVLTHTALSNEAETGTGVALTKASLEAVTAGKQLASQLNASLTVGIVAVDAEVAASSVASAGARLLAVTG
jgi:hypothetical protein